MNKHILTVLLSAIGLAASAQTAKQFTVNITDDGASKMEAYLPEKPNGRAIVVLPGGGYTHLAMDHEGHQWAPFFNEQGIACFVLTYRMPKGDRNIPISDAETAMRQVRSHAAEWQIDARNEGILGSSAGGHLAATVATHAPQDARPDFQVLFYPVITMQSGWSHQGSVDNFLGKDGKNDQRLVWQYSNELQVRPGETPPAIILLASDDRAVPVVTNGLAYYQALLRAGVRAAYHGYPSGGHGFGFRTTFAYHDQLLNELRAWLTQLK